MPSRLSHFVRPASPQALLPIMHTCDCYGFRGILEAGQLDPAPCKVFSGEPLVYLFYGRPAYRPSLLGEATSHGAFMPVSIVLREDTVPVPKRIYPFDSGAYAHGLFKDHIHPRMSMEDFQLSPGLDMPARLVTQFYGSNENYYLGQPHSQEIPPLEFEVALYYNLISGKAKTHYDDRRSAVEVQTDAPIPLNKETVLLVVLPTIFLDVPDIRRKLLADWSAQVRTYHIRHSNPNEHIGYVNEEVRTFLKTHRYI